MGMGCVTVRVQVVICSIAPRLGGGRPACCRAAFFYCKHAQLSHWAIPLFVCLEGGGVGGGYKACLAHACFPRCSFIMCVLCVLLPGSPFRASATSVLLFLRTAVVAVLSVLGCWCMRASSSSPFDRPLALLVRTWFFGFEFCTSYSLALRTAVQGMVSWVFATRFEVLACIIYSLILFRVTTH